VQSETIVEENVIPDKLFIILRGKVVMMKSGIEIATLKPGDFIGEMSFLSKEPASASAEAPNLVQYAYWTHKDLERLKIKNINTYNKFIAIIGCDLVRKLKTRSDSQIKNTANLDFVI
jgi:CRP-like cAMP-binding protein